MTDATQLVFENVHFGWGEQHLLQGLNIHIPKGKISTIMGPSGCGKTTMLRLIGGQLAPTTGRVLVSGRDIQRLRREELFRLRMRMGMMFQSSALFTDLNVFENVAFPLREHTDLPERLIRSIVLMKLHTVGLRGARDLMPSELSGGMERRVALARAIVFDPELIMYDDPFSGLDPVSISVIMRLIRSLNDSLGLTSIIVSHDVDEVLAISDQIFVISEGKVVEAGTPAELKASPSSWVRQFLSGSPDGPARFHYPAKPMSQALMGD